MKIFNFIICDDIRHEIGNKISLMGIYDTSIEFNVPSEHNIWPKHLKLGFFIKISKDKEEENPASFALKMVLKDSEVEVGKGSFLIPQDQSIESFTLALVNNQVMFSDSGKADFIFELYNKKNKLIEKLKPETVLQVIVKERK